jgi:hypothetical protein
MQNMTDGGNMDVMRVSEEDPEISIQIYFPDSALKISYYISP